MLCLSFEMLFAEQVVDCFDGIEGGQWNFDEESNPVCHGSIPEAGELLRFEHGGSFALLADEACGGVDIFAKVEIASFVVLGGAHKVDGVEVGGTGKNGFLVGVFAVNLGSLHNLEALDSMGVACEEGATAGFSLVAYHTADAHGAVEQVVQALSLLVGAELGVAFGQFEVQLVLDELLNGFELAGRCPMVEGVEMVEALLLQVEEQTGQHFLVDDGAVLHPVWHDVVDVLDEDEVGALLVEVLDEGAVSAGTEDEASLLVAHGVVLFVDSDDVRVVLLL